MTFELGGSVMSGVGSKKSGFCEKACDFGIKAK